MNKYGQSLVLWAPEAVLVFVPNRVNIFPESGQIQAHWDETRRMFLSRVLPVQDACKFSDRLRVIALF